MLYTAKWGFSGPTNSFLAKNWCALIGKCLKNYQSQPKMMILGVCGHFLSDFNVQYSKMGVFKGEEFIFGQKKGGLLLVKA